MSIKVLYIKKRCICDGGYYLFSTKHSFSICHFVMVWIPPICFRPLASFVLKTPFKSIYSLRAALATRRHGPFSPRFSLARFHSLSFSLFSRLSLFFPHMHIYTVNTCAHYSLRRDNTEEKSIVFYFSLYRAGNRFWLIDSENGVVLALSSIFFLFSRFFLPHFWLLISLFDFLFTVLSLFF